MFVPTRNMELSDYERLRIANIRRNNLVMAELGLESPRLSRANQAPKKRKSATVNDPQEPTRRSARHVGRSPPDYRDAPDLGGLRDRRVAPREAKKSDAPTEEEGRIADVPVEAAALVLKEGGEGGAAAPGFSKAMQCDVGRLLRQHLGRVIPLG